MSTEYIEKQWREITSRNPISQDQFATGLKDFKFSVGSGYGFIPNQSYFTVELKMTYAGDKPIAANSVAFADGCIGNMFNNIYFNIGGQTVSSLTTGVGQCEVLKNRLTKSKAYNETLGQSTGFVPHFTDRIAMLCGDAFTGSFGNNSAPSSARNQKMFVWKPALGIFDVSSPLGAGEYDIQLNPNVDFVKSAVQSVGADKVVGTGANQVKVEVMNMKFYACMVRTNLPSSGVETLHLMEMSVHTANRNNGSTAEINEEMSVPSSTRAISCFLQDQRAGKNTLFPPSRFCAGEGDELNLRNYQVQYANATKPSVRYDSNHTNDIDTQQQRYLTCALESGQFFNPAGFESYSQWLERGPFLHDSFIKAADNLATRVHVNASYDGAAGADERFYLVAHYSNTVQITRTNGMVSDIRVLSV